MYSKACGSAAGLVVGWAVTMVGFEVALQPLAFKRWDLMHSIFVDLQLGLSCAGLCPQQSLRLAYGSRPCLAGQGAVAVAALWCWAEATSGPIAWKGPPLQIVLHVLSCLHVNAAPL